MLRVVGFGISCGKILDHLDPNRCIVVKCWHLQVLGRAHLCNQPSNRRYLLDKTQHIIGGFGKGPGDPPDLYHSYLGLAALSILKEKPLKPIHPALCFSEDAKNHLESLPWRKSFVWKDSSLQVWVGVAWSNPSIFYRRELDRSEEKEQPINGWKFDPWVWCSCVTAEPGYWGAHLPFRWWSNELYHSIGHLYEK